jgi:predicted dinucleotide-binding enzyme
MPPRLFVCNDDSLGERIQNTFPETKVVKTLNTISNSVMVDPSKVQGNHAVFVAGNDEDSKTFVSKTVLTEWFGWKTVLDLGDIKAARATEMYLPLWLKLWASQKTADFNVIVSRGA